MQTLLSKIDALQNKEGNIIAPNFFLMLLLLQQKKS
jgi:hypothetical protein